MILGMTHAQKTLAVDIDIADANEEKRKEELREGAKKELDEWYRHHEEQIAKTKTANRYSVFFVNSEFLCHTFAREVTQVSFNFPFCQSSAPQEM
jgi:hypothetical protein